MGMGVSSLLQGTAMNKYWNTKHTKVFARSVIIIVDI
jgi:hypothetical protein